MMRPLLHSGKVLEVPGADLDPYGDWFMGFSEIPSRVCAKCPPVGTLRSGLRWLLAGCEISRHPDINPS
jgi:hypothetical protein